MCPDCNGTGIAVCLICENAIDTPCTQCRKDLGAFECETCGGVGEYMGARNENT